MKAVVETLQREITLLDTPTRDKSIGAAEKYVAKVKRVLATAERELSELVAKKKSLENAIEILEGSDEG